MNCTFCGKDIRSKRSTRKYCNSSCRARESLKRKVLQEPYKETRDVLVQDNEEEQPKVVKLTMEQAVDILNWYWIYQRDVLLGCNGTQLIQLLFSEVDKNIVLDKDRYVIV